MNIKRFLSVFTVILLSVTSSIASNVWINNPPADDEEYFYAVGYGETQKDAKSDALATISAKISVNVSSNFSNSVTATRYADEEDVLKEAKNEVISKSKDIEYTDVKVQESVKEVDGWVLLVQVDRSILRATYERKLQKVDNKIKTEWQFFKDADVFEKLKLSVDINDLLKETDRYFPLLYALDKRFDESKYISRYTEYTKEMRKAQKELVFKISHDKNSESLASLIKSNLSAQNATFSSKNYNVLIDIKTAAKKRQFKSTNPQFANLIFALRKTTIKATDKDGNVVSSTVYKTKEASSDGFEDAIQRTAKYEKKISELGIIKFITGN